MDLNEFWFGCKAVSDNLGNIVGLIKSKVKNQIEIAKPNNSISICTDIWSDKYCHNSDLDVTVVLVDNNFKISHFGIGFAYFAEFHTGDNIRYKIDQVL